MAIKLEDLKVDSQVKRIIGREVVSIVSSQLNGEYCQIVVRDGQGKLHDQVLFRDQESELELISGGKKWSSRLLSI